MFAALKNDENFVIISDKVWYLQLAYPNFLTDRLLQISLAI